MLRVLELARLHELLRRVIGSGIVMAPAAAGAAVPPPAGDRPGTGRPTTRQHLFFYLPPLAPAVLTLARGPIRGSAGNVMKLMGTWRGREPNNPPGACQARARSALLPLPGGSCCPRTQRDTGRAHGFSGANRQRRRRHASNHSSPRWVYLYHQTSTAAKKTKWGNLQKQ